VKRNVVATSKQWRRDDACANRCQTRQFRSVRTEPARRHEH